MPLKTARPDVGLGAAARVYARLRPHGSRRPRGIKTTPYDSRLDHAVCLHVISIIVLAGRRLGGEHVLRQQRGMRRRRYEAGQGARRRLHRREARTMKPWRRGCAGGPCGLGPLCTRINPETAIHSNTGNSPCSLSVVNLLLRRKPARAAVAPAQRPRGSAFEPDTETRLPPRFRPGIAPPVGARIADGASVAQGILEFPFGPFRERSSRMD